MNLNDTVTVVLTKFGAHLLNVRNYKLNKLFMKKSFAYKVDYKEGDVYENTLWTILGLFSDCFYAGHEAPFTDLEKSINRIVKNNQSQI